MPKDLVSRVGARAADRLFAFAERARAMSPVPVIRVVLFGSRARGDAAPDSDWDVAVVVHRGGAAGEAIRDVRNVFADLALPDIADGFHLRPIVIVAAEDGLDPGSWHVSPSLARNVRAEGVLIA